MLHRPIEFAQFTSWAFGHRLRTAGLLGSMGSIGDCHDCMVESFFGSMQLELLDRRAWTTGNSWRTRSSKDRRLIGPKGRCRQLRYRGVTANNWWLHTRMAALNLRRLLNLGLQHANGTWTLAPAAA